LKKRSQEKEWLQEKRKREELVKKRIAHEKDECREEWKAKKRVHYKIQTKAQIQTKYVQTK